MDDSKIAQLRKQRGMTQQQLADAAGVHIGQIARLECGQRTFTQVRVDTAIKIANALKVKDLRELI